MKRLMVLAVMLFLFGFSTLTFAAPFLVCDPQAGVTTYKLTGPTWVPVTVPAQTDGSIRMDVATATVGTNSLTVAACAAGDTLWPAERCSEYVPFVFTRPGTPSTVGHIKLIPPTGTNLH
jgi:hypothetical protein